jgi:putative nucleotidyltransferase with HDIG domain
METKLAIGEKIETARKNQDLTYWINPYTMAVSILGLIVAVAALLQLPADLPGLLLFAALTAAAELGSVELYISSRNSRVSVASVIMIASILVFGPLAGALTTLICGLVTLVTTGLFSRASQTGRVSWLRRSAFNTGMFVIAAFLAGQVYLLSGGEPGKVLLFSNLVPLAGAVTVQTLVNILLLLGVISLQTGKQPLYIWKQDFQWAVPISVLGGVLGGGALALAYERFGPLGVTIFFLPVISTGYSQRLYVKKTRDAMNNLEKANDALEQANETLEKTNRELMEMISAIIDAEDAYTLGHSKQVARYSLELGARLGLSAQDMDLLYKSALIHDLGKIGVGEDVFSKAGKLDAQEYNRIKRHPAISAEIISTMTGLKEVVPIVRAHHERWDGRGYPTGLSGEAIPLLARILAVADAVDVMCSDRPYRPTMNFTEMKVEVERCSGSQFDPQVVEKLLEIADELGPAFFPNSAALVDREVGSRVPARFLKKSMISQS